MSYNLLDLAKDTITGNVMYVNQETLQYRLTICKSCEYRIPPIINAGTTGTCGKCGCFLDSKSQYVQSECPIKKWTVGNV